MNFGSNPNAVKPGHGQVNMGAEKLTSHGHGIPISNCYNNQYPQAEINYSPMEGVPVEGTPLYTDPNLNPTQSAKLSRFRLQGFKDVWATILFLPFAIFPIVWGIIQLATYRVEMTAGQSSTSTRVKNKLNSYWILWACLAAAGASILSSLVILKAAKRFSLQMIYIANIGSILLFFVCAALSFVKLNVLAGLVLLVCGVLRGIWFFLVRDRIPFAAALLKASVTVVSAFRLTYVLNFLLCLLTCAYVGLWGYGMLAVADRFQKGTGNALYTLAIVVLVFGALWVSQVVPNVMHVTTCGLVATWYFAGFDNMPGNPTLASFKRATTTSFGSICFGSLLVALVEFIRFLVNQAQNGDESSFLSCLCDCILSCFQHLLELFNRYAFVHVAIYGCGYIEGAKRTYALCKQCFFAGYFNECLVAPTMSMFAFAVSLLYAFIAGIFTWSWAIGVMVFLISGMIHMLFFSVVESGVATVFVCFAECPEALRESDPQLYATIYATDANGTNNYASPPI